MTLIMSDGPHRCASLQKHLVLKICAKRTDRRHRFVQGGPTAGKGSVDANLGNGLIKQRIARPGSGRSGGYRTIIVFQTKTRAVFVFGFAKSSRANLSDAEEAVFKKAAVSSENEIGAEVASGRLTAVQ